jgi:glutathione-specific gamma-glutamylcyclotransferase
MRARLCGVGGTVLNEKANDRVWVFGYGSLIWRADFPFAERRRASINGWSRRFWQGSHDHRGVPDAPGRVVTLIADPGSRCDGVAYRVEHAVFDHLDHREKNGYERHRLTLQFDTEDAAGVVYIAPLDNHAYLGPAPTRVIAAQVLRSRGPSGSNVEYLYRLAAALRELDAHDPHVFELESLVRSLATDGHPPAA